MESIYQKIILIFFSLSLLFSYEYKTGDIILRKQSNIISDLFAKIDPCGYSHSGIILKIGTKLYVVHIEYSKGNDFKIVPFKKFIKNSKYKVIRLKYKIDEKKFLQEIEKIRKLNPSFDFTFSLNNKKYYCTELIDKIYFNAIKKHVYSYLFAFKGKKIITIRSILNNPEFKVVLSKNLK